jgi:hypothetical protein
LKKAKISFLILLFVLSAYIPLSYANAEGQYYHENEGEYSISFPDGWVIEDFVGENSVTYKKAYIEGTNTSILCNSYYIDGIVLDFEDYNENEWNKILDDFNLNYMESLSDYSNNTLLIEKVFLADYPFIKIQYLVKTDFENYAVKTFQTSLNNRYYTIITTMDLDIGEETVIDDIESAIKSFSFDKSDIEPIKVNSNEDTGVNEKNLYKGFLSLAIVGFILTYGIGVGIPLLFRKFITKGKVDRTRAIIYSVSWYIIQIIFFSMIGSVSKTHGGSLITSIITYSLLSKRNENKQFEKSKIDEGNMNMQYGTEENDTVAEKENNKSDD